MEKALKHYGVKGMRWGRRGYSINPNPSPKKKQSDFTQYLTSKDIDRTKVRINKEKRLKELVDEDLHPGRVAVRKIIKESIKSTQKEVLGDIRSKMLEDLKTNINNTYQQKKENPNG